MDVSKAGSSFEISPINSTDFFTLARYLDPRRVWLAIALVVNSDIGFHVIKRVVRTNSYFSSLICFTPLKAFQPKWFAQYVPE